MNSKKKKQYRFSFKKIKLANFKINYTNKNGKKWVFF